MEQKFFWIAVLENSSGDTFMSEKESTYSEIPRDKVKYFGLQGPQSEYLIDLQTGQFTISDIHRPRTTMGIKIPVANKIILLTSPLIGKKYYDFYQYKEGHTDWDASKQSSGNIIDEHVIGWKKTEIIPKIGMCFVETKFSIRPNDPNPKPVLRVILRKGEGMNPVAGSPYEIAL